MSPEEKIRFERMEDKINQMDSKLDDVLEALAGDKFGNSKGLVAEVKELKVRVRRMETLKNKVIWLVTGAALAAGFALDKIIDFFKKILPFLGLFLLVSGCITQQKRADIFHRHAREHKADVLDYCPPVESKPGRTDTVTKTDIKYRTVTVVRNQTDTIEVDCPETEVIYRHTHRTDTVADAAALEALSLRLIEFDKNMSVSDALLKREEKAKRTAVYWAIGLGLFAVIGWVIALRRGLF